MPACPCPYFLPLDAMRANQIFLSSDVKLPYEGPWETLYWKSLDAVSVVVQMGDLLSE